MNLDKRINRLKLDTKKDIKKQPKTAGGLVAESIKKFYSTEFKIFS